MTARRRERAKQYWHDGYGKMLSAVRFLVADTWRQFGLRVPLLVVLIILSGLFEGLAIAIALPLLVALGPSGASTGFAAYVAAIPQALGLPEGPMGIGLTMFALLFASGVAFLLQARTAAALQVTYTTGWQQRLFAAILRAQPSFVGERRAGDIVNSLVSDVGRVGGAFYNACFVLAAIVSLVIHLGLALLISPVVTLGILVCGTLMVAATRPYLRRTYSVGEQISAAAADVQSIASESIVAAKLVKASAAEDIVVDRFSEASDRSVVLCSATPLTFSAAKP